MPRPGKLIKLLYRLFSAQNTVSRALSVLIPIASDDATKGSRLSKSCFLIVLYCNFIIVLS